MSAFPASQQEEPFRNYLVLSRAFAQDTEKLYNSRVLWRIEDAVQGFHPISILQFTVGRGAREKKAQ